ncbi:MAG TPA: hypothetical protein VNJ12_06445 [Candidatus Dormibacteraeota bacterium]|nr:hypothetical protein [Candidatus Dormibacteraeota bacterium]
MVDGQPDDFRGHTTLIFERSGATWQIVFNHTSLDAPGLPPERAGLPAAGR